MSSFKQPPMGSLLAIQLTTEESRRASIAAEGHGISLKEYAAMAVRERIAIDLPPLRVTVAQDDGTERPATAEEAAHTAANIDRHPDETDAEFLTRKKIFEGIAASVSLNNGE